MQFLAVLINPKLSQMATPSGESSCSALAFPMVALSFKQRSIAYFHIRSTASFCLVELIVNIAPISYFLNVLVRMKLWFGQ